jgi:hypothetical protein
MHKEINLVFFVAIRNDKSEYNGELMQSIAFSLRTPQVLLA